MVVRRGLGEDWEKQEFDDAAKLGCEVAFEMCLNETDHWLRMRDGLRLNGVAATNGWETELWELMRGSLGINTKACDRKGKFAEAQEHFDRRRSEAGGNWYSRVAARAEEEGTPWCLQVLPRSVWIVNTRVVEAWCEATVSAWMSRLSWLLRAGKQDKMQLVNPVLNSKSGIEGDFETAELVLIEHDSLFHNHHLHSAIYGEAVRVDVGCLRSDVVKSVLKTVKWRSHSEAFVDALASVAQERFEEGHFVDAVLE
jgi:hypothetical protein